MDQTLLLRGSRDFGTQDEYRAFLGKLFEQLNSGRKQKLAEELDVLRPFPNPQYEGAQRVRVRVNTGSLIAVERNNYLIHCRLLGKIVEARAYSGPRLGEPGASNNGTGSEKG